MDQRLVTFLCLYEEKNYRKTAERLHITQPAVTQHIQSLETEYGVKLTSYEGRKLCFTAQGEHLNGFALEERKREEELRSELKKEQMKILRVGATKTIGTYLLKDMLTDYLKEPDHSVQVTVSNTEDLLAKLNLGELDVALVEGEFDKKLYGHQVWRREQVVCICSKTHAMAGNIVKAEELLSERIFAREEGSGTRNAGDALLGQVGYQLTQCKKLCVVNDFSLILQLVEAGLGVSLVYETVAKATKNLATFRIAQAEISREFCFVYLRGSHMESVLNQLWHKA